MATGARKVSAIHGTEFTGDASNVGAKVTYANAAAGDITQLSTNKVLLIVDADGTTVYDKQDIISLAEAAVAFLKEEWEMNAGHPSGSSTTSKTRVRILGY